MTLDEFLDLLGDIPASKLEYKITTDYGGIELPLENSCIIVDDESKRIMLG